MFHTHKTFLRKQTPSTPRKVANPLPQANHSKPPKKPSHMPPNGESISWDRLTRPIFHWPMGLVNPSYMRFFPLKTLFWHKPLVQYSSGFSQSYPPWTLFLKIILVVFHSQFIDSPPSPTANNHHPTHPPVTTLSDSLSLKISHLFLFLYIFPWNVYWHNLCVISISMCKICDIQVDAWVVIDAWEF